MRARMNNLNHTAIRHLERNITGARYLLEAYKIAFNANTRMNSNNKALADFLANTCLRSLILILCVIFNMQNSEIKNTNLSLQAFLNKMFINTVEIPPDLREVMQSSSNLMKNLGLYKLRNKKIAHLDLEEISSTIEVSDPETYEKLVSNAETIILQILIKNNLQPERNKPSPEDDALLQQLQKCFISK
jgi:hypothetical protein